MRKYILKRALQALVTLFAVVTLVFLLVRISGDPARFLLDPGMPAADVERIRASWGLDQPLWKQYALYLGNLVQGDFGGSLANPGRPAGELVFQRIPASLQLGLLAVAFAAVVSLLFGVYSAVNRGRAFDSTTRLIVLFGQAMPTFWFGILLIWLVAVQFGLVPTSGRGTFAHMLLPAFVLGLGGIAALTRLLRASMIEALDAEFVKLAKSKGVSNTKIIWKHCLRNALLGPLTFFGTVVAGTITGSVVVETVFAWPGVGLLAIQAVQVRDFPVVQTVVVLFAAAYILMTFIVDLLYGFLDPRIRLR